LAAGNFCLSQKGHYVYQYPPAIERLIESLLCLPTVGPKTAGRLAFYLLDAPPHQVEEMIAALQAIRTGVLRCRDCGNYASEDLCGICASSRRDRTTLCVVAQPKDIVAFERTGEFRGLYHVLGGLISPMEGRGPEHLRVDELESRLQQGNFQEVVLATDPTVAGEATALYLEQILDSFPGQISRLALGIPVGSDFEVTDEVTLGRALSYRQKVSRGR
jgi:recombination protein RecR